MKISYKWLKDYVDIDVSPEKLAEDLSLFGHEVESVEKMVYPEQSRGSDDSVLDFEITPNRGDCLSILGIAREISALYNIPLKNSTTVLGSIEAVDLGKKIDVKVSDPKICPRFTARVIDNIKIGESSKEIQEKLATYGFRSINNIVDITNYVMVATGQPLHAFDYDKIKDGLMNARQAKEAEEVITLDGQNRVLTEGAIIIEDAEKIYDLAGIMGGIKSEVDENTKTIILQGAIFDPILIRKTSKHLNHVTDASYRYERGVDFEGTKSGVDLATKLILDSCRDAKAGKLIDQVSQKQESAKIPFKIFDINHLLGTDITIDQAEDYLKRLNIKVETKVDSGQTQTIAIPPSYRAYDVKIWQDLAEEIARIEGYNNLGVSEIEKNPTKIKNNRYILEEVLRDIIAGQGYVEVQSYSFLSEDFVKKHSSLISGELVEIEKPLSPETKYLRQDLLPAILTQISRNPWAPEVKIFEIGNCFVGNSEFTQVMIAQTGKNKVELERVINTIKKKLKVDQIDYKLVDGIDPFVLESFKIRKPVIAACIDFEKLLERVGDITAEFEIPEKKVKYRKISKFAPTVRDIAFIVGKDLDAEKIGEEIQEISDKILFVELFDEFESEKFGQGKKNLAYHIWLQDLKGPMKENEASQIIENIGKILTDKYKAKLRS
jgi:phenylalanyl-tRNA synthetase beta chain